MLQTVFSLAVTVLVFGILIFIHEFGHYIVARKFGVGVIEFAIGMGPKLKTWKGKYNDFTLRAIPIGGFVNMVGEYDEEIPEEHKYKIPLNTKPVWQRILIVLAGPLMNIILAYLLMLLLVSTGNVIGSTAIGAFADNIISEDYGLEINDQIVEINGKRIRCYNDLSYKIVSDGIEPVDITVLRDGEEVFLEDVSFGIETEEGIAFGNIDFLVYRKEKTVLNVLYESFWQSVSTVYMTVDSLVDTFSGRYGMEAVGGPIAVGGEINNTIKTSEGFVVGLQRTLSLMMLISVSLGVFNLLPIPVLDGGRLLFYIIEAIRRKPLNPKIEQTLSGIFALLLFGLMFLVAFKDIVSLL
jgi:regulator of sigma E protease